jgi:hypothetical protein
MGWFMEDRPEHEGFLVALAPRDLPRERHGDVSLVRSRDVLLRELGYPDDEHSVEFIKRLKVGCACGWRSPELQVPFGMSAHYFPFVCSLNGDHAGEVEQRALELWKEHLRSEADRHWLIHWRRTAR